MSDHDRRYCWKYTRDSVIILRQKSTWSSIWGFLINKDVRWHCEYVEPGTSYLRLSTSASPRMTCKLKGPQVQLELVSVSGSSVKLLEVGWHACVTLPEPPHKGTRSTAEHAKRNETKIRNDTQQGGHKHFGMPAALRTPQLQTLDGIHSLREHISTVVRSLGVFTGKANGSLVT